MKVPNPQDYTYLWTDHDVNFIFTSCYLFKEIRESDMVFFYDHKDKGLRFYLSKKDIKRFSASAVDFYSDIADWEKDIKNSIRKGEELVKETEKDDVAKLNDDELKQRIGARAGLFQDLGGNYFYTEFFFLEKVEMIAKEDPKSGLAHNLNRMGGLKLEARKLLNKFYNHNIMWKKYIDEIQKRKERSDLQWLSFQEIVDILDNKEIPLSDRDKTYWMLSRHNDWNIIQGREVKDLMDKFENYFFSENLDEIPGTIANKGIYSGIVKVVRTVFSDNFKEEIKKVMDGDVLVAETTGPEMMLAIEKAGAIVTDEGGLTSHAAIVARELGIPCIVGTKVATKVLNDGDEVEVDADEGIVRKIR
ncbi:hypothetical protein JW968_00795 [Candidatus Woesearchaeota archaeon]|nr:hypothetical protein [Candidatus Woesearchaeota archaeon]